MAARWIVFFRNQIHTHPIAVRVLVKGGNFFEKRRFLQGDALRLLGLAYMIGQLFLWCGAGCPQLYPIPGKYACSGLAK
jgi:hypothetical protein